MSIVVQSVRSVTVLLVLSGVAAAAAVPAWTGAGHYRLLVSVAPVDLGSRTHDQMVASLPVDFEALHRGLAVTGVFNPASLQVHRYDAATGEAQTFPAFGAQRSPSDRPCRFEDAQAREDFPDRAAAASQSADGRVKTQPRARAARLFNREMDPAEGFVVWTHDQFNQETSTYAIYWDVAPDAAHTGPGALPWLGDVDVYRLPEGQALAGLAHLNLATGDLNNDGLFDLAGGGEKGEVMVFLNRGTPGRPRFSGCRLPRDEAGPLDCGWYSAPCLYDWDGDGDIDLLCGTSHNVILWWKNQGGGDMPAFSYQGLLQADGNRLEVPQQPVPEDQRDIFKVDYYNQPCVYDWNADGLPDVLTGGYTTGRVFLFLATGRGVDGVPALHYAGEVEADGMPIDTTWAASPLAGDFDDDDLPELITGTWNFHAPTPPERYLLYYKNVGTKGSPRLEARPFPKKGDFPRGVIARAASADWNNDGLTDLVVADCSGHAQYCLNVGTAEAPVWDFDASAALTAPWAFVPVNLLAACADASPGSGEGAEQLFLSGSRFEGLSGSPHLPEIVSRGDAFVADRPIDHPSPPYGDAYLWNVPADWDEDGLVDVLSCTFQGNVYFHRNTGTAETPGYDAGTAFTLPSGELLKVGPPVYASKDEVYDFTELQGSRAQCVVADFDGDGIRDLAVTETYHNIWIFRNTQTGAADALLPGEKVIEMPSRSAISVIDWNEDGKSDLLSGLPEASPGTIYLNETADGVLRFGAATQPFTLPYTFWGANFFPADWNRDGDTDFLIRSEFYLFWAEKSFLLGGYREATLLGAPETAPFGRASVPASR